MVAPDLDALHGPVAGVVELPHRLFWQSRRQVDLDRPTQLVWMYETVLRESARVDELVDWLDRDTLLRVWPDLFVPSGVRDAWQERHPVLTS